MRPVTVSLMLTLLCSCAATPKVLYTSFGRADPLGDAEVVTAWKEDRALLMRNAKEPDAMVKLKGGRETTVREFARQRVEATRRVLVLVDTVPLGLEVTERGASVTGGAGLDLLGRFTLRYDAKVPLRLALDDVKVLTQAAGGNLAVVSWLRSSQTSTEGAVGLLLRAAERAVDKQNLKSGKIDGI